MHGADLKVVRDQKAFGDRDLGGVAMQHRVLRSSFRLFGFIFGLKM